MKVIVRYYGIVEETIDVDDKFAQLRETHPNFDDLSYEEDEKLTDELVAEALASIHGDPFDGITSIETWSTAETLFEV